MGTHFERKLEELHAQMIAIGNLCEQAITLSAEAVRGGGDQVVRQVFETDRDIDAKEREIEGQCMKLLLLQQPVAGDLRRISAALRMVADMERIGDQAADIADLALHMDTAAVKVSADIAGIADATVHMVQGSIEAFVDMDLKKSRYVIDSDDIVDNAFNEIKENLADQIYGKKLDARTGLDILMTAKYFERIGDHAVNIVEWVEFAITGEHRNNEHEYDFEKEMAAFIK